MRKVVINGIDFNSIISFYRTHGSVDQKYYTVEEVEKNNIESIFSDRIFHIVKNNGTFYFIKEYLTDKDIATEEFKIAREFIDNPVTMNVYAYDDGKVLCEYISGVSLTEIKCIPSYPDNLICIIDKTVEFLKDLIETEKIHLFEVSANNVLVDVVSSSIRVIDLESNPLRYEEFKKKNLLMYNALIKQKDIIGGV